MTTEQLEAVIDRIMEKTKKEAYALEIDGEHAPVLSDSKFGGVPYWDLSMEYPCSREGKKLIFLAQINLSQAEPVNGLADTGMLQFFVGTAENDVFGIDFDQADSQDEFRVIYHKRVDELVTKEQVLAMDIPINTREEYEEDSPVFGEYRIRLQRTYAYMGERDYRFPEVFHEAVKEITGEDIGQNQPYQVLSEAQYDQLMEELDSAGHWVLGYPFFTQEDPRYGAEEYSRYDTMLFQMDSEGDDEGGDYVLWGDCGVANFFINAEDLQKKDFSRVLYNWDCF